MLKKIVKKLAIEAGFSACGIASVEKIPELTHLQTWLSKDYNASMSWLARKPDVRCDPKALFPVAKSVICTAIKYGEDGIATLSTEYGVRSTALNPRNTQYDIRNTSFTARFARGLEYHEYVKHKLKLLWNKIKQHVPDAQCKFCVDTSPILEKALAARAGIGWIGKNSLLIHPEHGSFMVLGEIITDIEFEPDKPIKNKCNQCTKCIRSCPTGAIVAPYIIDASRCISYLTIEQKDKAKTAQYGCDICQEVCPYNKF